MFASTDVNEIYLEVRPQDIAYIKFIIESYEILGIIRTVDRTKALIVVLAVPDAMDVTHGLLAALGSEIPIKQIPRPDNIGDDWLLGELDSSEAKEMALAAIESREVGDDATAIRALFSEMRPTLEAQGVRIEGMREGSAPHS